MENAASRLELLLALILIPIRQHIVHQVFDLVLGPVLLHVTFENGLHFALGISLGTVVPTPGFLSGALYAVVD